MIDLYVGINETKWNHHPVLPGPLACISPVYGASDRTRKENAIRVPPATKVRQDSGAFSDSLRFRLAFKGAYRRQREHAEKYAYAEQIEAIASYDLLIDEKWENGQRYKKRWSESAAREAVESTVNAARWIKKTRKASCILSAQGVTPEQYFSCVKRIAPFFCENDILGLGGWCILGKQPKRLMPAFQKTILLVVPFLAEHQVAKRIHIWGVCYGKALGQLLWLCDQYGIALATDSSGPQVRPARGLWGYKGWVNKAYKQPPVKSRGLERARHVMATRKWLKDFRNSEWYTEPKPKPKREQLCLF